MGIRDVVTYQEYASGMHTVRCVGRSQQGIPHLVTNEDQFKSVLVHAAVRYIFRSGKIPANISLRPQLFEGTCQRQVYARDDSRSGYGRVERNDQPPFQIPSGLAVVTYSS